MVSLKSSAPSTPILADVRFDRMAPFLSRRLAIRILALFLQEISSFYDLEKTTHFCKTILDEAEPVTKCLVVFGFQPKCASKGMHPID